MSVRTLLTQLLSDGGEVVMECRQCGTTVATETDQCPECGSDEIGRYRIE